MPNLLAHNLVAKRLYIKEAEQTLPGKENFIAGNYDFLSLGAQGPDPLFYFGIVPFHAPHFLTARKKLGEKIHREDGRKFFKFLLEQCYGIDDPRTAPLSWANLPTIFWTGKPILTFSSFPASTRKEGFLESTIFGTPILKA